MLALLARWRSGRLDRREARELDETLSRLDPELLARAAAVRLFDPAASQAQRRALLDLIARGTTDQSLSALVRASSEATLRPHALAAIATIADPQALPALARLAARTDERAVLEAIVRALRNIEGEKARRLAERIRTRLAAR